MKRKLLVECIREYAEKFPEKVVFYSEQKNVTYQDLWRVICRNAEEIRRAGAQKEAILVIVSQDVSYLAAYFSIQLAGAYFVPLSRDSSQEKIEEMRKKTGARFIYNGEGSELKRLSLVWSEEMYDGAYAFSSLDDICSILFTTGTTGDNKGVMLTHKNVVAVAENLVGALKPTENDVILVATPLNHANALRKIDMCVLNGSSAVIEDGFASWEHLLSVIQQNHVTSLCLPPSAVRMLLLFGRKAFLQAGVTFDYIESATAPLLETDKEQLRKLFPKTRLYNNYGSTESGSCCIYEYSTGQRRKNCIGLPAKNCEIVIMNEEGKIISSDEKHMGYLACRGDVNMKGYWREEKATQETIKNGYLCSNDMGLIDDEGYVYIYGRAQDVINVGGEKVNPSEIEEAAFQYDGIVDCGCVGMSHRILGEVPYLYVTPATGYNSRELTLFLEGQLEKHKRPFQIKCINEIPRTFNGKIMRRKLKELAADRVLPLHEPAVNVYIHHAFPLAALPEQYVSAGWIYNKFISLEYKKKTEEDQYLDYEYYDFFAEDDVFIKGFYWQPFRTLEEKGQLILLLKECIDYGEYIHALWNEKYIPDSEVYQRKNFLHACFLYGYNDEKKVFYTVNYQADMKWHRFEVGYDCLLHAITSDKDREPEGYLGFETYRPSPYSERKFEFPKVKEELRKLIFSDRNCYGIHAGKAFVEHAGKVGEKGEYIPRQSVYILYEHVSLMLERFSFMIENGYAAIPQELLDELSKVRDAFKLCIRFWLKYHLKQEFSTVQKLCSTAEKAIEKEREVLMKIWQGM